MRTKNIYNYIIREVEKDLKASLEGMVKSIFGPVQSRWVDAYFPFTHPSWEMEIYYQYVFIELLCR